MYFSFWNLLLAILAAYIIIKLAKWAIHKAFYDPIGAARRIIESRKY